MKRVEGFVCIGRQLEPRPQVMLFGKNTGDGFLNLQNFRTNDLTPFSNIDEAMKGYYNLKDSMKPLNLHKVALANIRLEIAQYEKEAEAFRHQRDRRWVALQLNPDFNEIIFYGKFDEKGLQNGHIGTLLETNGLRPFNNFESAYRTAQEINRQAQSPAQVASFYLRQIKLGK